MSDGMIVYRARVAGGDEDDAQTTLSTAECSRSCHARRATVELHLHDRSIAQDHAIGVCAYDTDWLLVRLYAVHLF
jgi:hypothetical protein